MKKNETEAEARPISLVAANEMIDEFIKLDKCILKNVDPTIEDSSKKAKAEVLNSRDYNAFLFHKDSILRFFDKSEYLMVILGAHAETSGDFEAGSFTIITTGVVKEKNAKETTFYTPSGLEEPATEYPPRKIVAKLAQGDSPQLKFVLKS